jgi:glycosyltransferase involved in cell wall biosynthesis
VLEALACGLPVVTTSHPDNLARHLVDVPTAGVLCEPEPFHIAAAITIALGQERVDASERARSLAEYDWDAVTTRVHEVLAR